MGLWPKLSGKLVDCQQLSQPVRRPPIIIKTNFDDFSVENGIKVLLKAFKMGFSMANIVVLVSSFQQNAQHLKSIHFWTNYKHFRDA